MPRLSRRDFLTTTATGGSALLLQNHLALAASKKILQAPPARKPSSGHRPQILTPFEQDTNKWQVQGRYKRTALWPHPGNNQSFGPEIPEWTAFYRYQGQTDDAPLREESGLYQVFVCQGAVEALAPGKNSTRRTFQAGDFFGDVYKDEDFCRLKADAGTVLLVKRQALLSQLDLRPSLQLRDDHSYIHLPFPIHDKDACGLPFEVNSETLHGGLFKKVKSDLTTLTALEYFHENTVAPSHYHADPIWHEFVYIQGGHLTPDGFYGPGDHIVSFSGIKEGPYLACFGPERPYPKEWPRFVERSLIERSVPSPWPRIFAGASRLGHAELMPHDRDHDLVSYCSYHRRHRFFDVQWQSDKPRARRWLQSLPKQIPRRLPDRTIQKLGPTNPRPKLLRPRAQSCRSSRLDHDRA